MDQFIRLGLIAILEMKLNQLGTYQGDNETNDEYIYKIVRIISLFTLKSGLPFH